MAQQTSTNLVNLMVKGQADFTQLNQQLKRLSVAFQQTANPKTARQIGETEKAIEKVGTQLDKTTKAVIQEAQSIAKSTKASASMKTLLIQKTQAQKAVTAATLKRNEAVKKYSSLESTASSYTQKAKQTVDVYKSALGKLAAKQGEVTHKKIQSKNAEAAYTESLKAFLPYQEKYVKAVAQNIAKANLMSGTYKKLKEKVDELGEGYKQAVGHTQKARHSVTQIKEAVNKYSQTNVKATQGLHKLNEQLNELGSTVRNTSEGVVFAEAKVEKFDKGIRDAKTASKELAQNMAYLSQSARELSFMFAGAATAMAGFVGVSVKAFMTVEKASDMLQASISNLSAGQFEELNEQLLMLTLTMPVTSEEILTMARSAAEAGVSAKNLVSFTRVLAMLTEVTGEMDVESVAKDIRGMMIVFNMAEESALNMASALRLVAKKSSVGADEIVQATMNASNSAQAANISFAETIGTIQILTQHYSSASRAGTGLRNVFMEMMMNSEELGEVMGKQGTIVQELNEDAYAVLLEYLERINQEPDIEAKFAFISETFSRRAAESILAIADNTDDLTEAVAGANREMEEATTLTEDYKVATDNLASEFQLLKNQSQYALVEIGKTFAEVLTPVIEGAQTALLAFIAVWKNLSDETKQLIARMVIVTIAVLAFAAALFAIIAVLAAFAKFFSLLETTVSLIATIPKSIVKGFSVLAPVLKFIVVLGVVIVLLWQIIKLIKVLGELFGQNWDVVDMIKDKTGLTSFMEKLNTLTTTFKDGWKGISDEIGNAGEAAEGAGKKFTLAMDTFGRSFMENFLYTLKEADWALLDSTTEIARQYYEILKMQGQMTEQQVATTTNRVREIISQAITEMRGIGEITAETQAAITGAVGADRGQALIKELIAGMNFNILQDAVDEISTELETLKEALKGKVEVINEKINDIKELYEDEIEGHEDILKTLKKEKKALQKAFKKDRKIYDARIEAAEKEYTNAKDALDTIKDQNDAEEDIVKEKVDQAKDSLEEQKDLLDKWKKLRKKEVDTAEGMTAWAELSYDASVRELEIMTALGKDEFDSQYRAAQQQATIYSERVSVAKQQELLAKQLYKAEEAAAEARIEALEEEYDFLKDQLDTLKKYNQIQEDYYANIAEIAKDRLEMERLAFEQFRDDYEDQLNALEEHIDLEQEALDEITELRDSQIEILEEEKELLEKSYGAQIKILEERKTIAEKELKAAEKLFQQEQQANNERLRIQDDLNASADDMSSQMESGMSGLLDSIGAATDLFDELFDELSDQINSLFKKEPTEPAEPGVWDFLWGLTAPGMGTDMAQYGGIALGDVMGATEQDWFKDASLLEKAGSIMGTGMGWQDPLTGAMLSAEGQGLALEERLEGTSPDILMEAMFGENWEVKMFKNGEKLFNSISTGFTDATTGISDWVTGVKDSWNTNWEMAKENWSETGTSIWTSMSDAWTTASTAVSEWVTGLKDSWDTNWEMSKENWSETGTSIWTSVSDAWTTASTGVAEWVTGLKESWDTNWEMAKENWKVAGTNIHNKVKDGWETAKDGAEGVASWVSGVWDTFSENWETVKENWGPIGTEIHDNIKEGLSTAKDGAEGIATWVSGVWDTWKENWDVKKEEWKTSGGEVYDKLKEGLGSKWDDVSTWATEIWGKFKTNFNEKKEEYKTKGQEIYTKIKSGLSGKWDNTKTWATTIYNKYKGNFDRTKKNFKTRGQEIYDKMKSGVTSRWNNAKTWGGTIVSKLTSGLSKSWATIKKKGREIIYKIKDGINEKLQWLKNTLYGYATSAIDWFVSGVRDSIWKITQVAKEMAQKIKDLIGFSKPPMEGPLSTIDKWGKHMVETYVASMEKAKPELDAAAEGMATTISAGIMVTPYNAAEAGASNIASVTNESTTESSQIITQDNSIHFHANQILATDGELREFTRKIQDFMDQEDLRKGNLAT